MTLAVLQENIFWAENGEKGVKNMRFRARLSNLKVGFSYFWYKTSLIYYFKYGIDSFVRKIIFELSNKLNRCEKALLTHILLYKAYLVTLEL